MGSVSPAPDLIQSHRAAAAAADDQREALIDAMRDQIEEHLLDALNLAEALGCYEPFREIEETLWQLQQEYRKATGYVRSRPDGRVPLKQKQRRLIFERDAYRCVLCGSHENLHVDHIKPVSKGGTNDDDNLRTLCAKCNLSKGARE